MQYIRHDSRVLYYPNVTILHLWEIKARVRCYVKSMGRAGAFYVRWNHSLASGMHEAVETAGSMPMMEGQQFLRKLQYLYSGIWPSPNTDCHIGLGPNNSPKWWYGMLQHGDPFIVSISGLGILNP